MTVAVGDKVLFVPKLAKWKAREYLTATVAEVKGLYVILVDPAGVEHVEYVDKVVLLETTEGGVSCLR